MQHSSSRSNRYTTFRLLAFSLAACNGRLEIMPEAVGGMGGSDIGGSAGAGAAPPACDDGQQNGDEAGVDCGGACSPCIERCGCASSDALLPLFCDPIGEPVPSSGYSLLDDDGGSVAFDICHASDCSLFRWTASGGTERLQVPGGATFAGMSADGELMLVSPPVALGSVALLLDAAGGATGTGLRAAPALLSAGGTVFGVSPVGAAGDPQLMRRQPGAEPAPLAALPFADGWIQLVGATPDGSRLVAYEGGRPYKPFRWSESGGLVLGLEGLPASADGAMISALSRDGEVFAGVTTLGSNPVSIYRFTEANGLAELAPATRDFGPEISPFGVLMSNDGSVLAFTRETTPEEAFGAFRWTEATGPEGLVPGLQSVVAAMSGDGRVIVGRTFDSETYGTFVWTEARGARSLRRELESSGVDLSGWTFDMPWSISQDGTFVAGTGTCGGVPTAYRMRLPE